MEYRKFGDTYIVRMDPGEEILTQLKVFAEQEGVKLAQKMEIPHLVITHHLPERSDEDLLAMEAYARCAFPGIHFARAGDVYAMSGEDETI